MMAKKRYIVTYADPDTDIKSATKVMARAISTKASAMRDGVAAFASPDFVLAGFGGADIVSADSVDAAGRAAEDHRDLGTAVLDQLGQSERGQIDHHGDEIGHETAGGVVPDSGPLHRRRRSPRVQHFVTIT